MATYRAVQVSTPNGPLEPVERAAPTPGPTQVLVRVRACGVCHSDHLVRGGAFPGLVLPRVPGHEIAGVIEAVGAGVRPWKVGDRVGVGWHGGHCFVCDRCRSGDFITCREARICGLSYDGGYAELMVAPQEALARMPDALPDAEAAPLLCAGVTTFNALRHSPARPGDLVAVQGLGGLGHLAVQFAAKMGFRTVAIARGADKRTFAEDLGADDYIDSQAESAGAALAARGGAKVVLATAPSRAAVEDVLAGVGVDGQLLLIAALAEPLTVPTVGLLLGRRAIQGWPSGTAKDSEETLAFAARTGVRPRIETFPLARVDEAFERMTTGKVRFRSVLTMS